MTFRTSPDRTRGLIHGTSSGLGGDFGRHDDSLETADRGPSCLGANSWKYQAISPVSESSASVEFVYSRSVFPEPRSVSGRGAVTSRSPVDEVQFRVVAPDHPDRRMGAGPTAAILPRCLLLAHPPWPRLCTRQSSSPVLTSWAVMKQPPGGGLEKSHRESVMALPFTITGPGVWATLSRESARSVSHATSPVFASRATRKASLVASKILSS